MAEQWKNNPFLIHLKQSLLLRNRWNKITKTVVKYLTLNYKFLEVLASLGLSSTVTHSVIPSLCHSVLILFKVNIFQNSFGKAYFFQSLLNKSDKKSILIIFTREEFPLYWNSLQQCGARFRSPSPNCTAIWHIWKGHYQKY